MVELDAQGDENAMGFSVEYPTNQLAFESLQVANPGISFQVNQATPGRLGLILANPVGQAFPAGPQELARIRFKTSLVSGPASLSFGDVPVPREMVNGQGEPLALRTQNGVLTVLPLNPPVIVGQPQNYEGYEGTPVTMSVSAESPAPLQYQWFWNGVSIPGADQNQLILPGATPAQSGWYSVAVRNAAGTNTSAAAEVKIQAGSSSQAKPSILTQPRSGSLVVGEKLALSVQAQGSLPLTYQWQRNGGALPGATNNTWSKAAVEEADAGDYQVVVANTSGSVTSAVARITVVATNPRWAALGTGSLIAGQTITVPLQMATLGGEQACALSLLYERTRLRFLDAATASPGAVLVLNTNYIEYGRIGLIYSQGLSTPMEPGTNTILNLRFLAYAVDGITGLNFGDDPILREVVDTEGNPLPLRYIPGSLTVSVPPAITVQPSDQAVLAGAPASFSLEVAGSAPLQCQWQFNGRDLPGETNFTLTLPAVAESQAGLYAAVVSNRVGVITSRPARLATGRTLQIANVPVLPGQSVEIPIRLLAAGGENAVGFSVAFNPWEWSFQEWIPSPAFAAGFVVNSNALNRGQLGFLAALPGGAALPAGPAEIVRLRFRPVPAAGEIKLVFAEEPVPLQVFDANAQALPFQSVTGGANVFVPANLRPTVIAQPASLMAALGSSQKLSVRATGAPPLFYQWQHNGTNLPGAIAPEYSLPATGWNDDGNYQVIIENGYGIVTSSIGILTVGVPPAFSQQPQSQALRNHDTLTLYAPALGVEPIRYQWFFIDPSLKLSTLATTNGFQLVIPSVAKETNEGQYYVSASNFFGVTLSFTAAVSVLPPLKVTQAKTTNVLNPGGGLILPLQPLNMENSGPGPFNYQWQINGEAIQDATNATYVIPSAKPGDGGSYRVVVASGAEAVAVDIADIIVQAQPVVAGDNFSDRIPLLATNGLGGVVSATNLLATREAGEPEHAGKKGSNSIWFKWVAPTNGNATFSTVGSTFDTLLAVYTGANVGTLVPVASDEDRGGYLTSKLQFPAANGVEYQVAVDGFAGAAGRVVLEWGVEATTDLLPGIVTNPAPQMVALGQNAQFEVQATGANLRYQWFRNNQPLPGASQSRLIITNVQMADMGNYLVQVMNATGARINTSAGAMLEVFEVLEGQPGQVPPGQDKVEDLMAGISPVKPLEVRWGTVKRLGLPFSSGYSLSVYSENNQATTQWLENQRGSSIVGHSRWHWLEVKVDAICTLSTEGSDFDTVLELYLLEGRELSLVGSDDNGGTDGRTSRWVGRVAEGGHYYVRVAGKNEAKGRYKLSSRLEPLQEYRQWGYQAGQGFSFTLRVPRETTFTVDTTTDLKVWQSLFTTNSASGKYDLLTPGREPRMFYRALLYLPPSAQTNTTGQVGGK